MSFVVFYTNPELGRGSHFTVLEGEMTPVRVAVKRARNEEGTRRARLEAEQLCKLEHRNIVKFFGVAHNHVNTLDIVLEYAEGGTLADLLAQSGPQSIGWIRRVVCQIADGLAVIHAEGIQHRDLKPENILFKDPLRRRPLIAGLGMATSELETSDAGAPAFHFPDERFSKASDIYCLAQIYCCITANSNATSRKQLKALRGAVIISINSNSLSRQVLEVVPRALSGESSLRPSAAEFRDAFSKRA